jgi:hypothetical protein
VQHRVVTLGTCRFVTCHSGDLERSVGSRSTSLELVRLSDGSRYALPAPVQGEPSSTLVRAAAMRTGNSPPRMKPSRHALELPVRTASAFLSWSAPCSATSSANDVSAAATRSASDISGTLQLLRTSRFSRRPKVSLIDLSLQTVRRRRRHGLRLSDLARFRSLGRLDRRVLDRLRSPILIPRRRPRSTGTELRSIVAVSGNDLFLLLGTGDQLQVAYDKRR